PGGAAPRRPLDALHQPLDGRGPAPLRPRGPARPRPAAGRRHPRGAGREGRRARRGPRARLPRADRPQPARHGGGLMLADARRLARNDLRLFFRDRTGLLLGFALPIALVTVFGFIMGAMGRKGTSGISAVNVAVLDEDGSPASAAFVQALKDGTTIAPELP